MVRACFTVLALMAALPASAQQLTLDIRDGLVTLSATNVPVRQVLAEWARIGGTRVVGAERISGAPLTLSLEGVPEGKALDIVLRGAAGYVAAARPVPGVGRSMYDRILVLATSTPPASGTPAAANSGVRAAPNPFGVPRDAEPDQAADVTIDAQEIPEAPVTNPFANAFGQAAAAANGGPFGPAAQPIPFGQPQQGQPFPQGGFFQPLQPPQNGAPALPQGGFFGTGAPAPGIVQPGVIQQPLPPQPPVPPGTRPRPQG